jgi:hypothetical protein
MQDKSYIQEIAQKIKDKLDDVDLTGQGLDELFDSYAVLALSKGFSVTNNDVHDAWSAWATKYDPGNVSLVPFDNLPEEIKRQDTPFTLAIKSVAKDLEL